MRVIYTVEKAVDGIGDDAWTARAVMSDAGVSASVSVRAASSCEAKRQLMSRINDLRGSLASFAKEIK